MDTSCKVSITYKYLHTNLIKYVNKHYIRIFPYIRIKVITYGYLHMDLI